MRRARRFSRTFSARRTRISTIAASSSLSSSRSRTDPSAQPLGSFFLATIVLSQTLLAEIDDPTRCRLRLLLEPEPPGWHRDRSDRRSAMSCSSPDRRPEAHESCVRSTASGASPAFPPTLPAGCAAAAHRPRRGLVSQPVASATCRASSEGACRPSP